MSTSTEFILSPSTLRLRSGRRFASG